MALQTPRRLGRPSLGTQNINTTSSPNLNIAATTAMARKASLNALTAGQALPSTPASKLVGGDGRDIEVGDAVDVPGGMHGTVKFIGNVHGKKGVFAGVELSSEYAARGKNDGDVDGTRYFTTSVPGSGIFLPLHRASRRASPSVSSDTFPPTPTTPSLASFNLPVKEDPSETYTPSATTMKFSQSVGPGARAPSPIFKPRIRPSLPRPDSPTKKLSSLAPGRAPPVGPSPARSNASTPRFTPSPAPGKFGLNKPRTPGPTRPYSRSSSRLGNQNAIEEDTENTPIGTARTSDSSMSGVNGRTRPASGSAADEVRELTKKLEERDKQLREQAASLAEMEASLAELQNLMPSDASDTSRPTRGGYEDADAAQLRILLREKNEKISMLTAEFDAHRADFRSTIDTLEMASTETERVYEKRVEDLMQEVRELQERSEDVETVARQLKQLEELVQELEEGLEDARRGEAEARGEVEFLRGEVERGRSELKREREKAAAALKGAGAAVDGFAGPGGSREVEQRDDEIRGLKAIIHSLSSGPDLGRSPNQKNGTSPRAESDEFSRMKAAMDRLEREKEELQGLVERKTFREEELERELDRVRSQYGGTELRGSIISNGMSERTLTQEKRSSGRDSKGTIASWRDSPKHRRSDIRPLEPAVESDTQSSAEGSVLWCELCESAGHNVLDCTSMLGGAAPESQNRTPVQEKRKGMGLDGFADSFAGLSTSFSSSNDRSTSLGASKMTASPGKAPTAPLPTPPDSGLVPGKGTGVVDPDKWCALCERDGHDSVSCPFEDAF